MQIDFNSTYIYDGKEYVLTGRVAEKVSSSGRQQILVEIKPKDGVESKSFFIWTKYTDLYKVKTLE